MEVPNEVLQAASGLLDLYDPAFDLLGEKDGRTAYAFRFPAGASTGFPVVYLYAPGVPVEEIDGPDAVALIASFDVE